MENISTLFIENKELILGTMAVFTIGWLIPSPTLKLYGKKVGNKIPKFLADEIEIKLNAFLEGLKEVHVDGDKGLITNLQLEEHGKKLKVELGLEKERTHPSN